MDLRDFERSMLAKPLLQEISSIALPEEPVQD